MDNLLENRQIRRLVRNTLLSQKRLTEAGNLTDESLREFADSIPEETLKGFYIRGTIELDAFEALLEYKYDLQEA